MQVKRYKLRSAKGGFNVIHDDKETKWKISIQSGVRATKRTNIEDFYVLILENEKIVDRCYINKNGGDISFSSEGKHIPKYISELAVFIMSGEDINTIIDGDSISNRFTSVSKRKRGAK